MFKLTYRKICTCFSSKCCLKYVVKIWKENIENCSSHGACRFEKTCFEKNAIKVLSCVHSAGIAVWETPDTPQEKREIKQKEKFSCMKPFASYSRRFKLNFKPKKTDFLKNLNWCCPLSASFNAINCLYYLERCPFTEYVG